MGMELYVRCRLNRVATPFVWTISVGWQAKTLEWENKIKVVAWLTRCAAMYIDVYYLDLLCIISWLFRLVRTTQSWHSITWAALLLPYLLESNSGGICNVPRATKRILCFPKVPCKHGPWGCRQVCCSKHTPTRMLTKRRAFAWIPLDRLTQPLQAQGQPNWTQIPGKRQLPKPAKPSITAECTHLEQLQQLDKDLGLEQVVLF